MRHEHHIAVLCRVLRVNRSTYYKHYSGFISPRELENQGIRKAIVTLHGQYHQRLGVRKMRRCLAREYGIEISEGRVYRLLKALNLPPIAGKKPRFIPPSNRAEALGNPLNQQFSPQAPNLVWVSDITYIPTGKRFSFLCVIMDLFARRVVSWKVMAGMKAELVAQALSNAIRARHPGPGMIFHSDQGSQYTSRTTRQILDQHQITPSYSRKGYPYDNAVMESFFKHLKRECISRSSYSCIDTLRLALTEYIDAFYNRQRPHTHNLGMTPVEKEELFMAEIR